MGNFGIPYMGSKDGIVSSLAPHFPKAEHFYDLFGGGFSVTHYMLLNRSKQYKHFHYNEIVSSTVELVRKSINGEYSYKRFKPKWISREDFAKNKSDAYVRLIWSFGNNQREYLFSKEIEPYKKSMHMAVIFNQFDELATKTLGFDKWPSNVNTIYKKRLYLSQKINWYRVKNKLPKCLHKFLPAKQQATLRRLQQLERLQRLQRLQQLQQLEGLERLQRLEGLERLNLTSKDYRDLKIHSNSVVYCDIPYRGTASYLGSFNHQEFYDWAMSRDFPVYVSEYDIPDKRFKLIYQVDKRGILSGTEKSKVKSEKLYWNGVKL